MWSRPNTKRILELDIKGLNDSDTVIYCHKCDFQITNVGMNPKCPNCGARLWFTDVGGIRRYKEGD